MRNKRMYLVALAVLASAGCGTGPMESVAAECGLERRSTVSVGDDGYSLTLATEGEENAKGVSLADLACVLEELETPDHVIQRMNTTRALDGSQSASWGELEASWSYHPDTGMNLIVNYA